MPHAAFKEVTKGSDWLAKWCKDRRDRGLDIPPDEAVQAKYRELAKYVQRHFSHAQHQINRYHRGADGWVIAHAWSNGGIVVSEEDRARSHETSSIKIPNLCKAQRIKWMDTFGMLEDLEADFSKNLKT